MALPSLLTKLYQNGGYGPKLKPEIIPFASSILSDSALDVASTQWVREAIGFTPLYVDGANGSDSNDGTTQATAVKTIGQALSLVTDHLGQRPIIYIAAGTYVEDVLLSGQTVIFELQGNVAVTGNVTVREGSGLFVRGSYTFSVNGSFYVAVVSFAYFTCDATFSRSEFNTIDISEKSYVAFLGSVSVTNNNGICCIFLINSGSLYCAQTLNLIANNATDCLVVQRSSNARLVDGISMSGSGVSFGIQVIDCSSFESTGAVTIPKNLVSSACVRLSGSSAFRLNGGNSVFHGSISNADSVVRVDSGSYFAIDGSAKLTIGVNYTGSGNLWALTVRGNSNFYIFGTSNLTFSFGSSAKTKYLIVVQVGGSFMAHSDAILNFGTGTVGTCTVTATTNGVIDIHNSASVSGSITGKRYLVDDGGIIYVHGSGANRIPGTTAGSATSVSYGYYG